MSRYGDQDDNIKVFFAEPIASIASGATNNGSTGVAIPVFRAKVAYLQLFLTALAGAAGKVTFNFVARGHEKQVYPTVPSFSIEVTANGATAVVQDAVVNCEAYYDFKLLSIVNAAGTDISAVSATLTYKH